MKLFAIGDSITQGFMSGAAARTDLAYPTLIAKQMGLQDYQYPKVWGAGGLPLNLEKVLRALDKQFGSNINGLDWVAALPLVNRLLDEVEDYYEREDGQENLPDPSGAVFYSNVAAQGFQVADAWLMTPRLCQQEIRQSNAAGDNQDGLFALPNAVFYRTALKVLNPSLKPEYENYSQLEWLKYHAAQEGVENVLVWLGANNALGTVIGLTVNQTPNRGSLLDLHPEQRRRWNLWHPQDFALEYRELLDRIDQILDNSQNPNCKVFVATVPLVTIAPIAKGVGPTTLMEVEPDFEIQSFEHQGKVAKGQSVYYKYYTYFFRDEEAILKRDTAYLTLADALHIDDCIRKYNRTIKALVTKKNQRFESDRYHVVDISKALQEIAYKRNAGQVQYKFPEFFDFQYPRVNTKYYHADAQGRLRQGGIFGLDGIHPTAIGQGLIAYEFLKVMNQAGVVNADAIDLNWQEIFNSDSLYSKPIPIMQELYENKQLAEFCLDVIMRRQTTREKQLRV
ncbi:hypothetical protein [Leptolyngbya ohadii]|uniref:hypothetical protein n=1 Tax=Leptolyngbya ohadii TaxID=1962290 RepID=UPI000B59DF6B|nr:hypothetical protein [Leptolyngbya ohadii]